MLDHFLIIYFKNSPELGSAMLQMVRDASLPLATETGTQVFVWRGGGPVVPT